MTKTKEQVLEGGLKKAETRLNILLGKENEALALIGVAKQALESHNKKPKFSYFLEYNRVKPNDLQYELMKLGARISSQGIRRWWHGGMPGGKNKKIVESYFGIKLGDFK